MGNNYLYNLGDSWAWGYSDKLGFDIPLKNTYADRVAEHFGLEKVTCCHPGWALGNAVERFLKRVYPKMTEGDCVLVTVPPDTRLVVAGKDRLGDDTTNRRTITVFSDEPMWQETVKRSGANPYHFELILNKDLLLIASLCVHKNVKYAFQHNYSTITHDPRWEMDLITDCYIDINNSMMDWLDFDTDKRLGDSLKAQLEEGRDGVGFTQRPDTVNDLVDETAHPNAQGHEHIGNILTHKLEKLWNMQPTNGIN